VGIDLSVWRVHRRIGMSGGLFVSALLWETGRSLSPAEIDELQAAHAAAYIAQADSVTALPGAAELLGTLTERGIKWAIATSGLARTARPGLRLLGLPDDAPMVTRDMVAHAKPDPDLFLAAAALLDADPRQAIVVGDSVWDLLAARRAASLGIGLLSGGYGREELERGGAYRVYSDPADLLGRLHEVGVRGLAGHPGGPVLAARAAWVPLGPAAVPYGWRMDTIFPAFSQVSLSHPGRG
jgi:HAD superfamily hydrolase (TIGR01509 family)